MSGTREAFGAEMQRTGADLHLVDHPVLRDPAGLDDQFSVQGGNVISAYDLAIIARTALAIPDIRQIVDLPEYRFTAPDGVVHVIRNVDRGLELYPGAIGIKTGYTKAAGNTFMAAATRDGRTMVAVVLQSPDIYRSATALLDLGFATPVTRESRVDHLPAISTQVPAPTATTTPSSGTRNAPAVSPPLGRTARDSSTAGSATSSWPWPPSCWCSPPSSWPSEGAVVRRRRSRYGSLATRRH